MIGQFFMVSSDHCVAIYVSGKNDQIEATEYQYILKNGECFDCE